MKKLYRFFKILTGYILAANGTILTTNGFIYIYNFIALCIEKKLSVFESGRFSVIGYVSYDFGYLLGVTFVVVGIYAICKGAKLAEISSIVKKQIK